MIVIKYPSKFGSTKQFCSNSGVVVEGKHSKVRVSEAASTQDFTTYSDLLSTIDKMDNVSKVGAGFFLSKNMWLGAKVYR